MTARLELNDIAQTNLQRGPTRERRALVANRIGAEAERLVSGFATFPWSPSAVAELGRSPEALDDSQRRLTILRLANHVEDRLDCAMH